MPFLFVDYDQGAGGEYFCANLSKSLQCITLESITTSYNRTKILDKFNQEFLKKIPIPKIVMSDSTLYDVVPCHRSVQLAKNLLGKIYSIRIANPNDNNLWNYMKMQQINKVFLAPLPSDQHFIGEIKTALRENPDINWTKKVKRNDTGVIIKLLSLNLEPTPENIQKFLQEIVILKEPEPNFDFDYIIPYENLFHNPDKIIKDIKKIFDITIENNWLDQYKKDYDAYISAA